MPPRARRSRRRRAAAAAGGAGRRGSPKAIRGRARRRAGGRRRGGRRRRRRDRACGAAAPRAARCSRARGTSRSAPAPARRRRGAPRRRPRVAAAAAPGSACARARGVLLAEGVDASQRTPALARARRRRHAAQRRGGRAVGAPLAVEVPIRARELEAVRAVHNEARLEDERVAHLEDARRDPSAALRALPAPLALAPPRHTGLARSGEPSEVPASSQSGWCATGAGSDASQRAHTSCGLCTTRSRLTLRRAGQAAQRGAMDVGVHARSTKVSQAEDGNWNAARAGLPRRLAQHSFALTATRRADDETTREATTRAGLLPLRPRRRRSRARPSTLQATALRAAPGR